MSKLIAPALAALLTAAIASPAFAQSAAARQELKRNCTADYSRLCSNFEPESPEVQQCFRQKRAQLSPRCQATIAKFEQQR